MARKKKDSLSAFENAMNEFGFNNPYQTGETTNVDNVFDDPDIDNLDNNEDNTDNTVVEDVDGNQVHDDNTDIPDDVLNNINNNNSSTAQNSNSNEIDNNTQDVDDNEIQGVGLFFDAFAEELGWDVEDEHKPTSIPALIDYIKDVVEENSTPQYADQRVQQLDEYVKNGGKFEDFYALQQDRMSYENLDLEDESNQKAAVREYLRYQGYDDNQINRKIERYEDSDMLEEEATDAVARLKYIREQELEQQRAQQEKLRRAQEEDAYKFMNGLTQSINSLDNIRGIAIPKEDRRALFEYITRTDENGLTRYQKDFNNNLITNLIESAYFTMKGDALLGEATRSGRTSAANKLRTMLKH